MKKISNENSHERIGKFLSGYEPKFINGNKYYEMTEQRFEVLVSVIYEDSTKNFKEALQKYTNKINIAWLDNAYGGRISTYRYDFAFIKFI